MESSRTTGPTSHSGLAERILAAPRQNEADPSSVSAIARAMSFATSWIDRKTVRATPLGQPSQIDLANEVNSPSPEEVTRARRILEAMRKRKKPVKSPFLWTAV